MTTVHPPAFSSPELQAAIEKSRKALEGADEARNRVSQDIKDLEVYLVGLGLTTPFRYPLGMALMPEDDQHLAASLEYSGSASGKVQQESLVLGEDAHGKMRLLHEVCEWEGYVEIDIPGGPFFWDESTLQREVKPLIEAKFEVRKRLFNKLPAFVTALAKHYAIDPDKATDSDGDIPF